MTMKIYLVEDDAVIAGHVARHLEAGCRGLLARYGGD